MSLVIGHWSLIIRHSSFAVFLTFLALYIATLRPGILPADSGEFQRVTATAGIAHPPGYPLYTMLGWLFTQLPLGATPAWRTSFFSAVTAAATVALVFSAARRLSGSFLAGLAAALTLGSATTFWATATKASIRPLTAFFAALCLYALAQYSPNLPRGGQQSTSPPQRAQVRGDRPLVIFALALSLGLTHHPSLAFPALFFVLYLILVDPAVLRRPRRWIWPTAAFLLGLLVLIYLPLRGPLRGAPDLATWSGFLDHVLARGFRGDMFALNLFDRLVLLPTLLRFQFNWVLMAGMLAGAALLLWRDRKRALLLVGSFLIHTAVTLTYDAPQTVEYEMPAYVSLALLLAVPFGLIPDTPSGPGSGDLGLGGPDRRRRRTVVSVVRHLSLAVLLIAATANIAAHFPSYRELSRSNDARDYAETVLREAPEDAVVLSNWHWFNPLRYLQQLEDVRPDVIVEYVAPGTGPLAQTWAQRIDAHIQQRPVVVVRAFEDAYRDRPYRLEPLGEAFLVRQAPRSEAPADSAPLHVPLGEQIELLGYRLESHETQPAQPLTLTLVWSPIAAPATDISLFAQLIGPDGRLWSAAVDPLHAPERLAAGEVVVDRLTIYPLLHASPGTYDLVIGAYAPRGRLTASDGSDAVRLDEVHLRPATARPVTRHPRFARLAGGPTLIGVDYDSGMPGQVRVYLHWMGPGQPTDLQLTGHDDAIAVRRRVPALRRGQYATIAVDHPGIPSRLTALGGGEPPRWNLRFRRPIALPSPQPGERYVPFGDAMVLTGFDGPTEGLRAGTAVQLDLHFEGQRPLERDYIVSTSLTGINPDGTWAWRQSHDSVPALGAIPTLKWIRGSSILDPHTVSAPDDLPSLPVVGSLLIYDHFTQRSLPHLDERLEASLEVGIWDTVAH
ncbi:MAG: DUF2723 domain-containing protein [Anaerolineae bacterium]